MNACPASALTSSAGCSGLDAAVADGMIAVAFSATSMTTMIVLRRVVDNLATIAVKKMVVVAADVGRCPSSVHHPMVD